ncbi:hypothetical protein B0H14DRAFT_2608155 [Mycena olivaceomarginata]|nr:hypothetical protein B0H14DRAFT_2608155 [Mycena olivaceomarginata]
MTLTPPPPLRRSARTRQNPNAPPDQEVPVPETTKPPSGKRKQIQTEGNDSGSIARNEKDLGVNTSSTEEQAVRQGSSRPNLGSSEQPADARAIATSIARNEKDLGVNTSSMKNRQGSSRPNLSPSEQFLTQLPPPLLLADQDVSTQGLHLSDVPRSFGLRGTSGEFRGTAGSSSALSNPPSPQTPSTMKTQSPPAFPRALTGTSPHASLSTVPDVAPAISTTQDLPPAGLSAMQDAPPAESPLACSIPAMQDLPPAALSMMQDVQNVVCSATLALLFLCAAGCEHPSSAPCLPLPHKDMHASLDAPPHASPSAMPDMVELPPPALLLAGIVPSQLASPLPHRNRKPQPTTAARNPTAHPPPWNRFHDSI